MYISLSRKIVTVKYRVVFYLAIMLKNIKNDIIIIFCSNFNKVVILSMGLL
jgi:hypothetical protein